LTVEDFSPNVEEIAADEVHCMSRAISTRLVNDFLGSTQVFATAVNDIIEGKLLREIAGKQLTISQFKLLKLVANTDAHSIGDVAAFLGVSNAAASKAVDKLVRRKMLVRTERTLDRRTTELSLTRRSARLLAAYEEAKNRRLADVFRSFSAAELQRTADILDQLSAGIVDHGANPEEICFQCGIYFREKCLVRKLVGRRCFYTLRRTRPDRQGVAPEEEPDVPAAPRAS
jgi:DNA-binding MarR family transcriptional regulator